MADDEEYENYLTEADDEGGKPKRASTAGRKLMRWNREPHNTDEKQRERS